jgi:hypothetical protein
MNANVPTCPRCGAVVTNPAAGVCSFCGSAVAAAPPAYGAPPPAYGVQPYGYGGGAPSPYGSPQAQAGSPYGQPPQGYAPYGGQPGYGYPPAQGGYPPQNPYGYPGGSSFVVQQSRFGWLSSGWGIYWMIRLGIALVVIAIAGIAACVNMLNQ